MTTVKKYRRRFKENILFIVTQDFNWIKTDSETLVLSMYKLQNLFVTDVNFNQGFRRVFLVASFQHHI